jgi:hypothetical protein
VKAVGGFKPVSFHHCSLHLFHVSNLTCLPFLPPSWLPPHFPRHGRVSGRRRTRLDRVLRRGPRYWWGQD